MIPYLDILGLICSAVFYARAAQRVKVNPLYWAGPSIVIYLISMLILHLGIAGCLLIQVVYFFVVAAMRVVLADRAK